MNKVLRKIAKKILLMPKVKSRLDTVCHFYYQIDIREDSKFSEIVRSAEKERLDIMEALGEQDAKALEKLVQMLLKDKMMIVEVGSWKGFSTAILAKTVTDYHGSVFAIDHWMGNEETWNYDVARNYDIYSIFKRNMISLGIWDIVHPLVMDSQTASQIFANGILDLVFIDADHRYEYVKKDIVSWLPKLKKGGILCGHDCEGYYSRYPDEIKKTIDEHLGEDYLSSICHPGVVRALYDCFQDRYSIMPDSVVWYYTKG
jgi:predicted O-methyltransferase YrrM